MEISRGVTSDTVISLKQGDKYVACGETSCKLESTFSENAKLMFRKGYEVPAGHKTGSPADTSRIILGDPFVVVFRTTADSFDRTFDCYTNGGCTLQPSVAGAQWGSPNKISIPDRVGALHFGDTFK